MLDLVSLTVIVATLVVGLVLYRSFSTGKSLLSSLMYLPLLVIVGIFFYKVYREGEELARLNTKIEQDEEASKDLAMRVEEEKEETKAVVLREELDSISHEIESNKLQLKFEKEEHERFAAGIRRIDDWDDFFALFGDVPKPGERPPLVAGLTDGPVDRPEADSDQG